MSDNEEVLILSESDNDNTVLTLSQSESSSDDSEEEIQIPQPKKTGRGASKYGRVTSTDIGKIERSDSPPPPPRRKYAPRKPLTEEGKQIRRDNLVKARAARSAYAAQRRVDELSQQLGKYKIRDAESSSDEEEIILTSKKKQKVLPTKAQEKRAKLDKALPKQRKVEPQIDDTEKIEVDGSKTLEKKRLRKQQEERLKVLEQMVLDQAKKEKKDRSRKTIINITPGDLEKAKVQPTSLEVKKLFLDLGI